MTRFKWTCDTCGSEDLVSDAVAVWDKEKQEWVMQDVCEFTYCGECEEECRCSEEEIEDTDGT